MHTPAIEFALGMLIGAALVTPLIWFVARMTVDAEDILDITHEAILRRVEMVELQYAEEQRSECPATDE